MTLEEAQKQVDEWIKTYGVRYFSELTNMTILTKDVEFCLKPDQYDIVPVLQGDELVALKD